MTNQRRNTTQPIDWWDAWEKAASESGMELAAWIGVQCNKALPKSIREKLSDRGTRGRPSANKSKENARQIK